MIYDSDTDFIRINYQFTCIGTGWLAGRKETDWIWVPKQLTDLDWWNNKFYSSYGIPKQYFGWTDDAAGFNGGSSLTIISLLSGKV